MRNRILVSIVWGLFLPATVLAVDRAVIKSPDGKIQLHFFMESEQLHFTIYSANKPVIEKSPVIMTIDGEEINKNAKIIKQEKYVVNETYPLLGAHAFAVNKCNGVRIFISHKKISYSIEARVFNDGIGFRLIVPGSTNVNRIPDERTVFNLPGSSIIWYHDMEMHYESVHAKKEISRLQTGEWAAPPSTFKLPSGIYASITEADLRGYPGMSLQANGKNGLALTLAHRQPTSYPYRLRYSPEDTQRLAKPAAIRGKIMTPWRVVLIGDDLNALVNNDIVTNLCPPPDPKLFPKGIKTEWIKPGRAVWKYLNGGGDGTVEVMKKFTDGAARLGFEHNILEGFWSRWTNEQLKEFIDYSREKNVGIWFWKHSKSLREEKSRDSFFQRCHDLGVTGVKIDFFDHEAKEVIDLYESILREAANYKLLLDFHGANKPTGQARTWPNEMVREAVKGMEASRLVDRATHETTIPFTRWLAGPAEYTVMHFGERRKNTTWAHQIASAAILSAPIVTYAAHPDTILANPAVDVIKGIPATWDETIVLPGSEIGELAAFARRKGNNWFVAVMNGIQPSQIKISLSFLKAGNYTATVVEDDPGEPAAVKLESRSYTRNDVIDLSLGIGGGFVVRLSHR